MSSNIIDERMLLAGHLNVTECMNYIHTKVSIEIASPNTKIPEEGRRAIAFKSLKEAQHIRLSLFEKGNSGKCS